MPNLPGVLIACASVVVVVVLMVLAVRRLSRRGSSAAGPPPPADVGPLLVSAEGLYLATTRADRPLERAEVRGWLFRDRATIAVHATGVRIDRRDGGVLWIPADHLTGAGHATWTIDRGVEPGGLTVLGWTLDDDEVQSSFRLDGPADALIAAAESLRNELPAPKELP